jgi:hypothetical protein
METGGNILVELDMTASRRSPQLRDVVELGLTVSRAARVL